MEEGRTASISWVHSVCQALTHLESFSSHNGSIRLFPRNPSEMGAVIILVSQMAELGLSCPGSHSPRRVPGMSIPPAPRLYPRLSKGRDNKRGCGPSQGAKCCRKGSGPVLGGASQGDLSLRPGRSEAQVLKVWAEEKG